MSCRLSPAQIESAPDGVIVSAPPGFTTMLIVLLVAWAGDTQAALEVTMQFTVLPLVSADVMKAGLLVPALVPLIDH